MSAHPTCGGCINGDSCQVRICRACEREWHILGGPLGDPYLCMTCESKGL